MTIALAADHAGFELKELLKANLLREGYEVLDLGAHDTSPSDYPDFAVKIGSAVTAKDAERGLLICGSGVGACIAANKIRGIRAGLCHDTYSARQGVEHDDVNVLVLGARVIGPELAGELVRAFLAAKFSGEQRHRERLEKIARIEDSPQRA